MVEVVRRSELVDVPTSHHVDLRKWVLAAAGKYPEGRMTSFLSRRLSGPDNLELSTSESDIKILVQSEGESKISGVVLSCHDMATIQANSHVSISVHGATPSEFYLLNWSVL
jgi:hypothetical protein